MTKSEIRTELANRLNQLASNESTVLSGIVTEASMNRVIDRAWRGKVFPILSDKFPKLFTQKTTWQYGYTATGVVDSASSSNSLVTTTGIFVNGMVGVKVQNSTTGDSATITAYVSPTTVTLNTEIGDTWDGATIYVLGNIFTLLGEVTDAKEVKRVEVKYSGQASTFVLRRRDMNDAFLQGQEVFTKPDAIWDPVVVKTTAGRVQAIEIQPAFQTYLDQYRVWYIQRPPAMADNEEPIGVIAGVDEVILDCATAETLRISGMYDLAANYEERSPNGTSVWPKGMRAIINHYKPIYRSGTIKRRADYIGIARRGSYI